MWRRVKVRIYIPNTLVIGQSCSICCEILDKSDLETAIILVLVLYSWKCLFGIICAFTLSQPSSGFYVSVVQVFWKHCGKKKKILVTSNFSFPTEFSMSFGNFLYSPQRSEGGKLESPWPSVHLSVRGHNFVRSFPTVLHVLLWNLYIMFVYIWSCAYAIFMTILSLVVELSSLELENFYWIIVDQGNNPTVLHVLNSKLHTMLLVVYSSACANILSVFSTLTKPFCDQNLLYDNALVGGMITFSDSSSCQFHKIWNCCLQTLSVWEGLKFVIWERVKTIITAKSKQCRC